MTKKHYKNLKLRSPLAIALTLLTICSPSVLRADEAGPKTKIEFPTGRTSGAEECFALDEYKSLAIIYSRYLSCEEQGPLVLDLLEVINDKQTALSLYADDLELALTRIEDEREAYVTSATTSAELAAGEERRKRVWRAVAIGGLVVSLALGAVVAGMGATQ
jgi:hypothetical protein